MLARVQKIIADSGYCSRRKAEQFIEAHAVKVNGHAVNLGDKADSESDIITVNGERLHTENVTLRYIKLYKPRGYITSMSAERKTDAEPAAKDTHLLTDLLTRIPERVYPVGRLDKVSEGLLLLTNDGAFANTITHPSRKIAKVYRVTIHGKVSEETIALMSAGLDIGEGETTRPCIINELVTEPTRTVLEFVITEGKNRQIRRMCEAVGLKVARLKRVSVGGVKLGMLKPGEWADLTKEELRLLNVYQKAGAKR